MALRLLVIFFFVAQQLAMPAALAFNGQAEDCLATSCCQVVEVTTCCGDVVQEMQCGKTGGDCRCGIEDRESDPDLPTPVPTDSQEMITALSAQTRSLINTMIASPTPPRWVAPIINRTHNESQALLSTWRT